MVIHHRLAIVAPLLSFLLLALLLAACGNSGTSSSYGNGGGGSTTSAAPTDTPASTPTSAPSPTPTPTAVITGPTHAVGIMQTSSGYAFNPASLTVAVGTTVIWTDNTTAPHTVTSNDGKTFDSGASNPISPGGSFSFKFTRPGTYKYHCQIHPSMLATIIVK